jgi:adenine-specific DNA-methyltransferase
MKQVSVPKLNADHADALTLLNECLVGGAERPRLEALINAFVYELFFTEELHARNLHPFAAAKAAGLMKLSGLEGEALARAANDWSRQLADPANQLYSTLFDLQSIDAVRIIEGR